MDTAFKKDTAGLRDVNGLIILKAIQSIDTAHYRRKNKLSRELAQASRNHEVPWININAEPSRVFEKAVDFRAKKYTQRYPHTAIRRGAKGA